MKVSEVATGSPSTLAALREVLGLSNLDHYVAQVQFSAAQMSERSGNLLISLNGIGAQLAAAEGSAALAGEHAADAADHSGLAQTAATQAQQVLSGMQTGIQSVSDAANAAVASATNAANSAAAAASSSISAATAATAAAGSAVAADGSAAAATVSATAAAASAATATTQAGNASASASTAATHAGNASTSAGAAATSASAASGSAGAAASSATAAGASASAAAISASTAESAAGPTYASIALGEAATTTGQSFAVDNGDGTVSVYLRTGGGSTLQRTLATTAALSADTGASLVGFKQSGTGAVARTIQNRMLETISVLDFIPVAEHAAIRAGTSSYDCRAGIQAAIDYAIYGGGKAKVRIPAGVYMCSGEICLGYGIYFNSVHVVGDGYRYAAEAGFNGTALVFTHNNAPAISFQGSRGSSIRSLSIRGANSHHIQHNGLGTFAGTMADLNPSTWVDPAFPAASSSRYAPYAGIAIDPRSGVRPGVSYPDVAYPAHYVGTPTQYGKNFSGSVRIKDVEIDGFVVGIVNQPCDADGNGDFTKMHGVQIVNCQYSLSICNSQARDVHFVDGWMNNCHTAVVTTKHGRQIGKPGVLVESTEIGACIQWLDVPNLSTGAGPAFKSCYGEQIYRIGNVGLNSQSNGPVTFDACEFNFESQLVYGAPAYLFENNGDGHVIFNGCRIGGLSGVPHHFAFHGPASSYFFRGCTTGLHATHLYEKCAMNFTGGISCARLSGDYGEFTISPGIRYHLDGGSDLYGDAARMGALAGFADRAYCVPLSAKQVRPSQSCTLLPHYRPVRSNGKSSWTFSTSGRDVTFDSAFPEWRRATDGFGVGDIVWDDVTGVTFYVKSRTGTVITLRAMTGYDGAGNLLTAITNAGAFYSQCARMFTPRYPIYADTTAASKVISNVNGGDVDSSFIGTDIAVGDFIFHRPGTLNPAPANYMNITARDGGAGTITMLYEATHTRVQINVPYFVRPEMPNPT